MSKSKPKLSKSFVESHPLPEQGQIFVRDAALPGFGVKFTKKYRTYFVERKVNGSTKRVTVGRHVELTLDQARKQAQSLLGELAKGVDVTKKRRDAIKKDKAQAILNTTLREAYEDFIESRSNIKPSTRNDYDSAIQSSRFRRDGGPNLLLFSGSIWTPDRRARN